MLGAETFLYLMDEQYGWNTTKKLGPKVPRWYCSYWASTRIQAVGDSPLYFGQICLDFEWITQLPWCYATLFLENAVESRRNGNARFKREMGVEDKLVRQVSSGTDTPFSQQTHHSRSHLIRTPQHKKKEILSLKNNRLESLLMICGIKILKKLILIEK